MRSVFFLLLVSLSLPILAQQRDPTEPPISDIEVADGLGNWAEELELTQIFYSEQNQSARLNGEWVKPGETIGRLEVISITPNSVMVKKNDEAVEITLFKPIKQNKKGSPEAVQ